MYVKTYIFRIHLYSGKNKFINTKRAQVEKNDKY